MKMIYSESTVIINLSQSKTSKNHILLKMKPLN
jgi:hypothetical protein